MNMHDMVREKKEGQRTIIKPIQYPTFRIDKLRITPNAMEKLFLYRDLHDDLTSSGDEFFGFQIKRYDEKVPGLYSLTRDLVLGKDQVNHGSHTLVRAAQVQEVMRSLHGTGNGPCGWWHRHPGSYRSSSGEDLGNNPIVLEGIQTHNQVLDYMIIPMDHMKYELEDSDDGAVLICTDKRDHGEYIIDLHCTIAEAKDKLPEMKKKRIPVKLAYAHSMIVAGKDRTPNKVYTEVITRLFHGNDPNIQEEKNGRDGGLRTKIEIVEVPDDIIINKDTMVNELTENIYIKKFHKHGIHLNVGRVFGDAMIHEHDRNSVYKRFRGGYEFVHDHDDKISKETWIETAKPYLLDHLSLQEVNEWEDKVLNEKKIPIIEKVTSILKDEKTIADKVTDEAATKDKTVTAEDAVVDKTKPELGKINPFMKFVYAIFKPSKLNKKDNKQLAKEYRADNGAEPVKAKTDATKNEDTPNKGVN